MHNKSENLYFMHLVTIMSDQEIFSYQYNVSYKSLYAAAILTELS